MVKRIEDIKMNRKEVVKPSNVGVSIKPKINPKKVNTDIPLVKKSLNVKPRVKRVKRRKIPRTPRVRDEKFLNKTLLRVFVVVLLVGTVFWGSLLFENARITISKKRQSFGLDKTSFSAFKGFKSSIPFEIMIVSDEFKEKVSLDKTKEVSLKASGEITLYNEYSQKEQKISAETYISDEGGKVYLTDKAVTIPGYSEKNGKVIPGEVKVQATSFLPGEEYNGSPKKFTINSFKGTTKYEKIYGKGNSDFSGGAQGEYYYVSEDNLPDIEKVAFSTVKKSLIKQVNSLIPDHYIFYPEASSFNYEFNKNSLYKDQKADIKIIGNLSVILIEEKELKNILIKKELPNISDYEINSIKISGIEKLTFGFSDQDLIVNKSLDSFDFSLTGNVEFIWEPDILKIKNILVGIPKDQVGFILSQEVGVGDAMVKTFPIWKPTLPIKTSKIKIRIL